MIRRFLSGVFWGGAVSALGLGAISQLTPLPVARIAADAKAVQLEKPATAKPAVDPVAKVEPAVEAVVEPEVIVEPPPAAVVTQVEPSVEPTPTPPVAEATPAAPSATVDQLEPPVGSEFAEPLPDAEPVLPAAETAPPLDTTDVAPLAPPAADAASVTDAPSMAPETGLESPTALVVPTDTDVAVVPPVAAEPDQIAMADPVQPAAPPADVAPAATENPAPAAVEEPKEALLKPLPEILPVPEPESVQTDEPSLQLDPDAGLDSGADSSPTLAPTPGLEGDVDGVTIGRLPRIGDAVSPEGEATAPAPFAPEAEADPALTIDEDQSLPPLQKYARSFANPEAKPLFSIILIDTGGADLDRAALAALPFPVTFALDPLAPGAVAASKIYRDAGQEVIMVATGIPAGATAADLEVTFQAHAATLPETVAVIDTEFGAFQADRPLATQVVPILQAQGRGLISWDRGLNAADQVARREGLAATLVFRKLDGNGENTAAIRRALDRAAFKAAQDGRVTVIGQTFPATVAALLEWAVEGRASTVALAPVSAVLIVQ